MWYFVKGGTIHWLRGLSSGPYGPDQASTASRIRMDGRGQATRVRCGAFLHQPCRTSRLLGEKGSVRSWRVRASKA